MARLVVTTAVAASPGAAVAATRFRIDAVNERPLSDFKFTPPTALVGLIRTANVTVNFNLTVEFFRESQAVPALVRMG